MLLPFWRCQGEPTDAVDLGTNPPCATVSALCGSRHKELDLLFVMDNSPSMAQLRLSAFARRFAGSTEVSICDIDRYASALDKVGQTLTAKPTTTWMSDLMKAAWTD